MPRVCSFPPFRMRDLAALRIPRTRWFKTVVQHPGAKHPLRLPGQRPFLLPEPHRAFQIRQAVSHQQRLFPPLVLRQEYPLAVPLRHRALLLVPRQGYR